ncbi:hypothetical protein [Mucilaginibacter dorajii]|uniref:Uncharacterized protein n=1 Tax=Mucilaginibacter dorajii TaxID=692994 RepID=A0ABP7PVI8_9SPHI|nr:hypothetical protein [Mucilaginibacter dorajii]MCS3734993.1 peptidoglycan/LPS O-acetylase OafA/YrhL [Mucilaginibacter dorajii]
MLNSIYLVSLLFSFACGLLNYNRLPKAYKWLTIYQLFAFCYELAIANKLLIWHHTNSWCNNLEGVIELLLFTYLLASFNELKPYKKAIYLVEGLVLIFTFVDIAFIQGFFKFDTIATVVMGIFLLILVFAYYYLLLTEATEDQKLLYTPDFLMASGLSLYLLGTTFFYACFSYMAYKNNPTFLIVARTIPNLANLIFVLLITLALLCFFRKKKQSINGL